VAKAQDESTFLTPADRAAARNAAGRSMLGPWGGQGRDADADAVSVLACIAAQSPQATYATGFAAKSRTAGGDGQRRLW
jgi:hypothetical protein